MEARDGPTAHEPLLGSRLGHGGTKLVPKERQGSPDFMVNVASYVAPVLVYALVNCLITYFLGYHSGLVWGVVTLCGLFGAAIFVTGGHESNYHQLFLGALILVAVFWGVMGGLANYSWFMRPYYHLMDSREYYNVLPSEMAQAHGDAGKMTFALGTMVDRTKTVGYNMDGLWCVAPIIDQFSLPRVEYWAVGKDCCKQRSEFGCGDALKPGARGAIVQLPGPHFLVTDGIPYWKRAVQVAEAAYDVQSADEPLFVRWVADPTAENDAKLHTANVTVAWSIGIYVVLNALASLACIYAAYKHDAAMKEKAKRDRRANITPRV